MSILENARLNMQKFMGDTNGFAVPITLKTPDEATVVLVNGVHTKTHMAFNPLTGEEMDSKMASVAIAEQQLIDQGFPVIRNVVGDVNLNGTLVDVVDSSGVEKSYVVTRVYPDEMLGLLVFILGDYKTT